MPTQRSKPRVMNGNCRCTFFRGVTRYVGPACSATRSASSGRTATLGSREVPLLLNFGAPHRRLDAVGSGEWTTHDGVCTHDGVWVAGVHNRHQLTKAVGERQFMVVRFTPMNGHSTALIAFHIDAQTFAEALRATAAGVSTIRDEARPPRHGSRPWRIAIRRWSFATDTRHRRARAPVRRSCGVRRRPRR